MTRRRNLAIWGGVAAGTVILFSLVFFVIPPLAVSDDVGKTRAERTKLRNDFRSTETQFLGGLAIAAGLIFTWRTLGLNRKGQLADRFSKAIDQLGSKDLDVRLGAIYSLERIARDSKDDHGPVLEVLTAYVRRYERTDRDPPGGPAYDVQAICTVLGRRSLSHDGPGRVLDLAGADLRFTNISGSFRNALFTAADLDSAMISEADLDGASLVAARAGATIVSSTIRKATLQGAVFGSARIRPSVRLDESVYDRDTTWPADFDPTTRGALLTG
jgi:hypothetical protein